MIGNDNKVVSVALETLCQFGVLDYDRFQNGRTFGFHIGYLDSFHLVEKIKGSPGLASA